MLPCSFQVQSDCSCAQTTSNDHFYHRYNFGLDTFRRSVVMDDSNAGSKAFSHSFFRITKSTFLMLLCSFQVQSDCSCAQTTSNDHFYHL